MGLSCYAVFLMRQLIKPDMMFSITYFISYSALKKQEIMIKIKHIYHTEQTSVGILQSEVTVLNISL